MNIQDCIKFANENPLCFLATVEGDQPRVRALAFWFADESGFYFQTGTMKAFYGQLKKNSKTEACFLKQGDSAGMMLRVSGEVEFIDDIKLKERVIIDRPFLKSMGIEATSPALSIFRIKHGQAHFWNMESNLKPKQLINF
jgi:pyridoxamine 5'-phosphate oxidase